MTSENKDWMNQIPEAFSGSCSMGNRTLFAEGLKFNVNSDYLSIHSEFFKTLFNGDFKEKNEQEIELKDVTAENLRNFLQLIYPGPFEITGDNYLSLIDVSVRFMASCALHSCRTFVEKNFQKLDKLDLLEIGFKFNLKYMKESVARFLRDQQVVFKYSCTTHPSYTTKCCNASVEQKAFPVNKQSFIVENRDRISKFPAEIQMFILQTIMNASDS